MPGEVHQYVRSVRPDLPGDGLVRPAREISPDGGKRPEALRNTVDHEMVVIKQDLESLPIDVPQDRFDKCGDRMVAQIRR